MFMFLKKKKKKIKIKLSNDKVKSLIDPIIFLRKPSGVKSFNFRISRKNFIGDTKFVKLESGGAYYVSNISYKKFEGIQIRQEEVLCFVSNNLFFNREHLPAFYFKKVYPKFFSNFKNYFKFFLILKLFKDKIIKSV